MFLVIAPAVLPSTLVRPPGLISNPNLFSPLKLKVAEGKGDRQGETSIEELCKDYGGKGGVTRFIP
jgi:hypothetical protein